MAKLGEDRIAIELNQEEFDRGYEYKGDIDNCIGATMLRKAFPTIEDVHYGRYSGFATDTKKTYQYSIQDPEGKELDIMEETSPRLLYLMLKGQRSILID